MTNGVTNINNPQLAMQRLKAAQIRADNLRNELQAQQSNPIQQQAQTQQVTQAQAPRFDALQHSATMNLYNNNGLSPEVRQSAMESMTPKDKNPANTQLVTELREANRSVETNQGQIQQQQGNGMQAILDKLPPELTQRSDIQSLVQQVGTEALMNPESVVDGLVQQALTGNKAAYVKLNDYSKNPYEKLQENASKGIEQVMGEATYRPAVLEMIAGTNTEKSEEASALLFNLAHKNPSAAEGIERLARNGAINLTKTVEQAKNNNPAEAASSINTLLNRKLMSKTDTQGMVNTLSEIARENPTGASGSIAAKGLTNAVMNQPLDIAQTAAVGLKNAAMSGNNNALTGLQNLSKLQDQTKAQLALTQLSEIAKSGSSGSSESLQSIRDLAEKPGTPGKTRAMAVENLGDIASQGGSNSQEALKSITNVATNRMNPASSVAFNEAGKMNSSITGSADNQQITNPKKDQNLSDSDTYKKFMALQQQFNASTQAFQSNFGPFAMRLAATN